VTRDLPADDQTTDWPWQLGARRRKRNEAEAVAVSSLADHQQEQRADGRRRWPAIVMAMRTLIARYNAGAGTAALVLVDRHEAGRVEVMMGNGSDDRVLSVEFDGTDLSVRAHSESRHSMDSERRINFDRTDSDTAAYVLQNWMGQL
jgi:hypothetical protein